MPAIPRHQRNEGHHREQARLPSLLAATLRKTAEKGLFTLNAADGQPRVGITDNSEPDTLLHWQANDASHLEM